MAGRKTRKKSGARSKYTELKGNPVLVRWLANLGRGSPLTAEVAVRRLGKTCELLGVSPEELLDKARRDLPGLQDSLEDMVAELEKERMSPGYIEGLLKVVKSLLRYHGVVLPRKIKISNLGATPTIDDEQVPTQGELSRIFRTSPPRVRAAEALIAFAGLRIETLSNFNGSDGLRLKDLPELKLHGHEVVFERMPTMVAVRATLSKRRRKYFTFLPSEGCIYLKEYLEGRIREGERLGPNSPLIIYEKERQSYTPAAEFMKTTKVSKLIRQYMRKAGVQKRPYVLRAYADTQFIIAESKGKIPHAYVQFFMGHKGDIEARYSTEKGRLTPDMIEDMRKCYRDCEQFLSTIAKPLEQSDIVKEAKVEALKTMAKSLLGIDLVEVKVAKERELKRDLNKDEELELFENELKKLRDGTHNPKRIVGEGELERHLVEGWQFVSVLPSQKILIKKE
jgi:hypothetical protein